MSAHAEKSQGPSGDLLTDDGLAERSRLDAAITENMRRIASGLVTRRGILGEIQAAKFLAGFGHSAGRGKSKGSSRTRVIFCERSRCPNCSCANCTAEAEPIRIGDDGQLQLPPGVTATELGPQDMGSEQVQTRHNLQRGGEESTQYVDSAGVEP